MAGVGASLQPGEQVQGGGARVESGGLPAEGQVSSPGGARFLGPLGERLGGGQGGEGLGAREGRGVGRGGEGASESCSQPGT